LTSAKVTRFRSGSRRVCNSRASLGRHRLLVGLGAEVIRIEPPGGDSLRADPLAFGHWHAGKRSIVLDLETRPGWAALLAFVATADVLVETSRPGHLERLGLGPATLAATRPELITVSVTPLGRTGPRADWVGTDLTAVALGGMMSLCGHPDGPPLQPPREQGYHLAGLNAAIGARWDFEPVGSPDGARPSTCRCRRRWRPRWSYRQIGVTRAATDASYGQRPWPS
jgi:hypothetical protein